jgi:hypothetical protein
MTDRLTLTRALEGSGMQSAAAERIATEIYDAIHNNVATKADIAAVRGDMREMEQRLANQIDRMVIRLGSMIVVATGVLVAVKYSG